jgi:Skp family chaperone for outer membrane proteins
MQSMKWTLALALALASFCAATASAQQPAPAPLSSDPTPSSSSQEANIQAYVELLRSDVRARKTEILTELMNLNDTQSAKFWPIYREYDVQLQKINDQRLAGILDYAKNFQSMTDEKADQLAKLALALENQRNELKKTYYEKLRDQLGGGVAARFLQVENQMLMVIDLQIASSLPVVEK